MSQTESIDSSVPQRAYVVPDIGALAKRLRAECQRALANEPPATWNHSRWLNVLARASGQRNYQTWLAQQPQSTAQMPCGAASLILAAPQIQGTNWRAAPGLAAPAAASTVESIVDGIAPGLDKTERLHVIRACTYFDKNGRLVRWPTKRSLGDLVVWPLWMRFALGQNYTEAQVTAMLAQLNGFKDPVTLRRELINAKLLGREKDGSRYWRVAREFNMPPAARALMAVVAQELGLSL
jgi:hypothetical protein